MNKRFLRNTIYGSATALSTTLGSFLVSLLVARLLGVAETGVYAFAMWIVAIVATVTGCGLPFTLSRYLPEVTELEGERNAKGLARYLLLPSALANMVPAIIAGIFAALVLPGLGEPHAGATSLADPVVWLLIGLCCSAQGLSDFAKGYLRGIHSLDRVAKLTSLCVLVQLAAIAAGVALFGPPGALAGYFIGALIPTLALRDLRASPPHCSEAMRRRITRYAAFRCASEIASAFVFARIEIFFLQLTSNTHDVGLFAAALTISNLAVQGPLMLTWGLLPHFSEQFGKNDVASLQETFSTGTRLLALVIFPACLGLAALAPQLTPLLYGAPFAAAVPAAVILVAAASLSATASIGSNLIWAMEKSHIDLTYGLTGAFLSVAVGLPLIAHFGLMGAAVARAATQTLIVVLAAWFLTRRLGFTIPFAVLGKLAVSAVACALAAYGVTLAIHGIPGLILAIIAGAAVYFCCIKLTDALDPSDAAKLYDICGRLPRPFGGFAQRCMRLATR